MLSPQTGNCLHLLSMYRVVFTITCRWLRVRKTEFEQWSELKLVVATIHPGQCPQHPVQSLLDDHRDGIKESKCSTLLRASGRSWQPGMLGCPHGALSLATHKASEAHCAKSHKVEVQRLQISPALYG